MITPRRCAHCLEMIPVKALKPSAYKKLEYCSVRCSSLAKAMRKIISRSGPNVAGRSEKRQAAITEMKQQMNYRRPKRAEPGTPFETPEQFYARGGQKTICEPACVAPIIGGMPGRAG